MQTCGICGRIRPDTQDACDCAAANIPHSVKPRHLRAALLALGLVVAFVVALSAAVLPCAQLLPAPDGGDGYSEAVAEEKMRRIAEAETRFHDQNRRYGDLAELGLGYQSGSRVVSTGYYLNLAVSPQHFQLTATPGAQSRAWCCLVGMPRCRFFYTDESLVLRHNRHCLPASDQSSAVPWPK